jgi:hypothetical protein
MRKNKNTVLFEEFLEYSKDMKLNSKQCPKQYEFAVRTFLWMKQHEKDETECLEKNQISKV